MKTCECKVCVDERRWRDALNITTPEAEKVFREMIMRLEAAETDACVSSEIFKGRWPGSQEILERSLSIVRQSQNDATCAC